MSKVNAKTPATTPDSTIDDEHCLVPQTKLLKQSTPWYCTYPPPYAILTASVFELIIYFVATKEINQSLRFDPNSQTEAWRFVSYMFLHNNIFHVALNVVIQCLFAITLEKHQSSTRVGLVYFGSGATGALGASCVRPEFVVGASAGVYALLISHLSQIILQYNSSKYKVWIFLTVMVIVASDVTYYFVHSRYQNELIISEGAHIAGGISGFLLGLILYQSSDKESKIRNRVIFWLALILFVVFIVTLLMVNWQIKRCTSEGEIRIRYNYMC